MLARAKLHFTPVVLTPQAHLQRVGKKTLSPIPPLGRESNSLAESGILLEVTEKLCCQACSTILRVQERSCFSFSVLRIDVGHIALGKVVQLATPLMFKPMFLHMHLHCHDGY